MRTAQIVSCLCILACGPNPLSQEDARRAFSIRRSIVTGFEDAVAAKLNAAKVFTEPKECTTVAPSQQAAQDNLCTQAKNQQELQRDLLRGELQKTIVDFVDRNQLLGATLEIKLANNTTWSSLHIPPCTPGVKNDSEVKDTVDAFDITAGLYQTAWEDESGKYGDGAYHRGLIVRWKFQAESASMSAALCFLLDGTKRPKPQGTPAVLESKTLPIMVESSKQPQSATSQAAASAPSTTPTSAASTQGP